MIQSPTPVRAPESDGTKSPLNAFIVYLRVFISTLPELSCQWQLKVKSRPWGLRSFSGSFPSVPCRATPPLSSLSAAYKGLGSVDIHSWLPAVHLGGTWAGGEQLVDWRVGGACSVSDK